MKSLCVLPLLVAVSAGVLRAQEKALPPVAALQATALANLTATTAARERYLCRERVQTNELDSKGRVTKVDTAEVETFFVRGYSITQTVSRNGTPLTPDQQKKQQAEVAKAIAKIEKEPVAGNKKEANNFSPRDVLQYGVLTHERRLDVAGRPTIVFDVVPSDDKGGSIEAKIIHAMRGTVSIDEASGRLQDVNVAGERDVKVGGGLVANIHKGFRLHQVSAPMNDGVWLTKTIEGKGDARVGLFLNKGADFRRETESCRLYDVAAAQTDGK